MQNLKLKIKNVILVLSLLAVALYMAPEARAATLRNIRTGPGSINTTSRTDVKAHSHASTKLGGALNIDVGLADTGNNNTDGNTVGPNNVTTGGLTGGATSEDFVNYSTLTLNQSDTPETDLVENDTTGPGSNNSASIVKSKSSSFTEHSTGGVLNLSLFVLNTGGNSASGNTAGPNTVDTGDADITVSHKSDVNSSDVTITQ